MSRGVNGMEIFKTARHKLDFMGMMGNYLPKAGLRIHAWAIMNNHFHLLAETGEVPLSAVMQRLLTKWAMGYNHMEKRQGRVFQGRYRSILVDKEKYFFTLMAYINMNPLRSGYVRSEEDLDNYQFSGHCHSKGIGKSYPWENPSRDVHRHSYREAVLRLKKEMEGLVKHDEPVPSEMVIDARGILPASGVIPRDTTDHRIFIKGDREFVMDVISGETDRRLQPIRSRLLQHSEALKALEKVCGLCSVSETALRGASRRNETVQARKLLIHYLILFCGFSFSDAGRFLGRSRQAAAAAFKSPMNKPMLKALQNK